MEGIGTYNFDRVPTAVVAAGTVDIVKARREAGTVRPVSGRIAVQPMSAVGAVEFTLAIHSQGLGRFAVPVESVSVLPDRPHVELRAGIGPGAVLVVTLNGEYSASGADFRVRDVSLGIDKREERARADLAASTLWAILGLSVQVTFEIPALGLKLDLQFGLDLPVVAQMLARQRIALWYAAIETATGSSFDLPEFIPGEEIEKAAFAYRAVSQPHFEWPGTVDASMPALAENLDHFREANRPQLYVFGPEPRETDIFGQRVDLGRQSTVILDGVVEEYERVVEALRAQDGHTVPFRIRSLRGFLRYSFSDGPKLLERAAFAEFETLRALALQLNEKFFEHCRRLPTARLELVYEADRNNFALTSLLGGRYMAASRWEDAERVFQAALGLAPDPDDPHGYDRLADIAVGSGVARLELGKIEDAIRDLLRARWLDENNPEPNIALAYALASAGRASDAERALKRALELDPTHAIAKSMLGTIEAGRAQVLLRSGETDAAEEALASALSHGARDGEAFRMLGAVHARRNRPVEAAAAYRAAMRRGSDEARAAFEALVRDHPALGGDVGAPAPSEHELTERFVALSREWLRDTAVLSSIRAKVAHPAYATILELGERAIPLVLGELKDRPAHWLAALKTLTGANPVSPGATFDEAAEAWLRWGKSRGYL